MFNEILLNTIDVVAPVKEVRLKSNTHPWIDNTILEAIKFTNVLFRKVWKDKRKMLHWWNSKKLGIKYKNWLRMQKAVVLQKN